MLNKNITQLIKDAQVLSPADTIRRAEGLIRSSGGSSLLISRQGQIVGTISERAISAYLSETDEPNKALDTEIEPLIDPNVVFINYSSTCKQAAQVFATSSMDVLPVIDEHGAYHGVLYRKDLIGYLTKNMRPATVAGMATPLGVYLTTGSQSGGAGSLGLFLTGVTLGFMMFMASLMVLGLQHLYSIYFHISPKMFLVDSNLFYVSTALNVAVFFLIMRLSPISGYHAAEHMTVHAIEAGEELSTNIVRRMPRVHPRCGTNLLAAASVFMIITNKVNSQFTVLIAMVVVIIGWRSIGGLLQHFITTKTPSDRQLKNGVAAGNQLLDKFNQQPNYQVFGFRRMWNMGFIQTAMGMAVIMGVLSIFESITHIGLLF